MDRQRSRKRKWGLTQSTVLRWSEPHSFTVRGPARRGWQLNSGDGILAGVDDRRGLVNNSQPKEPSPKVLREWSKDPLCQSASRAMETLEEKGCELHLIDGYLRRIVFYRDMDVAPFFMSGRVLYHVNRQLRDLPRQIRKLAKRLHDLSANPAVWGRLLETRCHTAHVELLRIADELSQASRLRAETNNFHREAILDLLDLVHRTTGRYHYSEIADLINAAYCWQAIRKGEEIPDMQYDVARLKMIVFRGNRKLTTRAARWHTRSKDSESAG